MVEAVVLGGRFGFAPLVVVVDPSGASLELWRFGGLVVEVAEIQRY